MSGPSPPGAGPSPVGPSRVGPSQAGPSPNAPPKKAKSAAALYEFKALSATRRVWFGAAVGGVSGVSYGLLDSYREVDSRKWKLADAKSVDFAAKNTLKMSVWFAGYFGLFQVLKYGAMVARKENDVYNTAAGLAATSLCFAKSTSLRNNLPYVCMLVALDAYHDTSFGGIGGVAEQG